MKKTKTKPLHELFNEWREDNDLTIEAFATTIGVRYNTVIGWTRGRCKPLEVFQDKIRAVYTDCPLA